MQHHAPRVAHRLAPPVARQARLVEPVPGLVQNAHQRTGEIGLVVARGDAHVVGGAAGEGMGRDVEPSVMKIEAEAARHLLAQPALRIDGERAVEGDDRGKLLLALEHAAEQIGQKGPEFGENDIDARRTAARFEFVEQGVIERCAECCGLGLADAAHDRQHFSECRQQRLEIGVRPGRPPGMLAGIAGARTGLDEIARQGAFMHPAAPHLVQVGGLPRIEPGGALLRPRQQFGHVGRHHDLVGDPAEGCELVGAVFAGAVGHHGRAIPVQDRAGAVDRAHAGKAALQFGIRIIDDHGCCFVRPAISNHPFSQW